MEKLVVAVVIGALVWSAIQSRRADQVRAEEAAAARAAAAATPGRGLEFVETVAVKVDHPAKLASAINDARRAYSRGGLLSRGYVVGAPVIAPDGLTANILLFR